MEQVAIFEPAARAKYLDLDAPESSVDLGVELSLRDLTARLEADLPSLRKRLSAVEETVKKNEAALKKMVRDRTKLWADVGPQFLHVLRFGLTAAEYVRQFDEGPPGELPPSIPSRLRGQHRDMWKEARCLARRDLQTAQRAREYLVGLYRKAGREDEVPALEAAAAWSSREPNADLMVALSK